MHDVIPGTGETIAERGPSSAVGRQTLELGFACSPDGATFLEHQRAPYPFHVGRALHCPGDPAGMATVYVQSSSGGIYEGERLGTDIAVANNASAHVTTQASTIVHGMHGGAADHRLRLEVATGALLEYLPDPLILFPASRMTTEIRIARARGARAIVGDCFLGHDPKAMGRGFDRLASDLVVEDEMGHVLARDRYVVHGGSLGAASNGDRPPFAAHGSLVLLAEPESCGPILQAVREDLAATESEHRDIYSGASTLPAGQGIWVRILAADGVALRRAMMETWRAMRQGLAGEPPRLRRK